MLHGNLKKMLNVFVLGNTLFACLFINVHNIYAMGKKLEGSQAKVNEIYEAINKKEYDHAIELGNQCFDTVKDEATLMQQKFTNGLKPKDPFEYWALNDAGECLFLIGEAYRLQGKNDQANKYYQRVIKEFPDSFGGTTTKDVWKVKEAAEAMINKSN